MNDNENTLLRGFSREPPATNHDLLELESAIGKPLPADYKSFLMISNGGEGFIGEGEYLMAWPVRRVLGSHLTGDLERIGLLGIGSNGGLEIFAIDLNTSPSRYIMVPSIGASRSLIRVIGNTFEEFIVNLSKVQ